MADEPHPQARTVLDIVDTRARPPTYALSVESARAALKSFFVDTDPDPVGGEVSDFSIEGPESDIPVRLYTPGGERPHPALVYLHGGGFVLGDLDTVDNVCRAVCRRAECAVLSVDYRRAPEHVFPAALEDSYAAVSWLADHGDHVGVDTDRIAVGGDSAGANLTAGVTLMARDDRSMGQDAPDIARQVLVYPVVSSAVHGEFDSYEENGEGYFLERDSMHWFHEKYLPDPTMRRNEYAAPLLAGDLSGLPPATVVTAGFDPLRDEGQEYADRLESDGVDVSRHHYEGMIHGFVSMLDYVDPAHDALDDVVADLSVTF
ncbi:alpha/beta hydrolase [Halomarina oriensis]|uniref:Alpha/beta hydrolase fold domain-containing protein n=1 Tax=Halomarina oriensis TaxID=671145 RepID=A0A6B0GNA9_9EURY|nr:alpha/beta hydrolase [Halomarina oriensis]MWG33605.1 alpha/beta hydrolase fold domain-containing protein [Halomarina oriensis]